MLSLSASHKHFQTASMRFRDLNYPLIELDKSREMEQLDRCIVECTAVHDIDS
jgi:hypothetical protein